MTKKPCRFVDGNAYATAKQRIIEKLKAFYGRFFGLVYRSANIYQSVIF